MGVSRSSLVCGVNEWMPTSAALNQIRHANCNKSLFHGHFSANWMINRRQMFQGKEQVSSTTFWPYGDILLWRGSARWSVPCSSLETLWRISILCVGNVRLVEATRISNYAVITLQSWHSLLGKVLKHILLTIYGCCCRFSVKCYTTLRDSRRI
jgi:hypothetical protein